MTERRGYLLLLLVILFWAGNFRSASWRSTS
jgi:hypothetical protein